jgi:hypothetical protein
MKTATKLGIIVCLTAMASYAESWTGKLIDASCYNSNKAAPASVDHKGAPTSGEKLDRDCAPTATTSAYALHANGKVYMLDSSGNAKAAADFQGGAIKPDKDGDVHVTVSGKMQGDTISVDSLKFAGKNK